MFTVEDGSADANSDGGASILCDANAAGVDARR
jgi:hypothetical protein